MKLTGEKTSLKLLQVSQKPQEKESMKGHRSLLKARLTAAPPETDAYQFEAVLSDPVLVVLTRFAFPTVL